jgi:putative protease
MSTSRKIELLAPAKNLETGIAAINHGADAVYIGAAQFGARQAAGNSVEDIARLVEYAHLFGVKVYVTLNTIIYDDEVASVEQLVAELYKVGVDALIVQDMGIAGMNIPPIPLHASTQMDNRTVEKAKFLAGVGFPRIVLARELSLSEIKEIHDAVPDTELEVFVHGALCVSYSGQCYASQHCFGRSANRGACAQFCRLPFDLVDAEGTVVMRDKHLLSLKDMNRSAHIEQMLDAGVTSFKIEGRLKDVSYVKNITAYYRAKLDEVFARRPEYERASYGKCAPQFTPAPEKSFSRGFTDYMLNGSKDEMTSFDTPKSKGEYMGRVKFVSRNFFTFTGKDFNNGDGACFVSRDGRLKGFHINRVEGNRIFPQSMPQVESGDELYRNYDCDFERQLSRPDVARRMRVDLTLCENADGFVLKGIDESGLECSVSTVFEKQEARTSQRDNIVKQLGKWGNTPFEVGEVNVEFSSEWFVPSSLLSDMRRSLCEELIKRHNEEDSREDMRLADNAIPFVEDELDYKGNVSNSHAKAFYMKHGVKSIMPAFENEPVDNAVVMFCKHCIKFSLGWCTKSGAKHAFKEPFYLVSGDGKRFRLSFDCKECMMKVIAE